MLDLSLVFEIDKFSFLLIQIIYKSVIVVCLSVLFLRVPRQGAGKYPFPLRVKTSCTFSLLSHLFLLFLSLFL